MKKFVSICVVAHILICTIFTLSAVATVNGTCGENLTWILDENGTLTISGYGDMYDWSLASPWKESATEVVKVVISYGVTSIGEYAFNYCNNLKDIIISNSVTEIGAFAFASCSSLKSITIPDSVMSVEAYAFSCCNNLENIFVEEGNDWFSTDKNGVLFDKDKKTLICCPAGSKNADYVVPDGVTMIGKYAFSHCSNLENIIISNSVTKIGNSAFNDCTSLKSITIANSVTNIGDYAFIGCDGLENVYYTGKKLQWVEIVMGSGKEYLTIGTTIHYADEIFAGACGESITWTFDGNGILTISGTGKMDDWMSESSVPWREHRNKIVTVIVESGVTNVGKRAFCLCDNLTNITIPKGVTKIGAVAFSDCVSLESIEIPDSVKNIESYAFSGCSSLENVILPDGIISIGASAFSDCICLENVIFPDTVKSIDCKAFSGCDNLTSIRIPDSVTSIYEGVFASCNNLTEITVDENNEYYSSNKEGVLFDKNRNTLICYPAGKTETEYIIPDSVATIGALAFSDCIDVENIKIPNSVKFINEYAFSGCTKITRIEIPNSVTRIGWRAFYCCSNLVDIIIPNSISEIWEYTFENCSNLINIKIPSSIKNIYEGAFSDCRNLKSITIPDSVTWISLYAFYGCSSLNDVYYEGTEEQWKAVEIEDYNEPLINATIHFKGNNVSINKELQIILTGETSNGYVYVALYDGKKLKGIKKYVAEKNINASFDSVKEGNIVKVLWWKNNMQPICSEAVIVK